MSIKRLIKIIKSSYYIFLLDTFLDKCDQIAVFLSKFCKKSLFSSLKCLKSDYYFNILIKFVEYFIINIINKFQINLKKNMLAGILYQSKKRSSLNNSKSKAIV